MSLEKLIAEIDLDQLARDAYRQAKHAYGYSDAAISDAEFARGGACKETASPMTRGLQGTLRLIGGAGIVAVTEIHGLFGGPYYDHRYSTLGTVDTPHEDWYVVDGTWLQRIDSAHPSADTLPKVLVGPRAYALEQVRLLGSDERAADLYKFDTLTGYDDLPPTFDPLAVRGVAQANSSILPKKII